MSLQCRKVRQSQYPQPIFEMESTFALCLLLLIFWRLCQERRLCLPSYFVSSDHAVQRRRLVHATFRPDANRTRVHMNCTQDHLFKVVVVQVIETSWMRNWMWCSPGRCPLGPPSPILSKLPVASFPPPGRFSSPPLLLSPPAELDSAFPSFSGAVHSGSWKGSLLSLV